MLTRLFNCRNITLHVTLNPHISLYTSFTSNCAAFVFPFFKHVAGIKFKMNRSSTDFYTCLIFFQGHGGLEPILYVGKR